MGGRGFTHAAVRSRETTFDINEVFLDFHFGHYDLHEKDKIGVVAVALYFIRGLSDAVNALHQNVFVEDFRNIGEGGYFIREISPDEFFTSEFEVKSRRGWPSRYTFAHSEQILVPGCMFVQQHLVGDFYFIVVLITQNEDGYYSLIRRGYRPEIHYRLLENNQVRLWGLG